MLEKGMASVLPGAPSDSEPLGPFKTELGPVRAFDVEDELAMAKQRSRTKMTEVISIRSGSMKSGTTSRDVSPRQRAGRNAMPTSSTQVSLFKLDFRSYQWQWQDRTGSFNDYAADDSLRIELAYQRGESKVRLKANRQGHMERDVPLEIFFVDMLQHDPSSGGNLVVRRVGPDGFVSRIKRSINEFLRELETGRKRRESFKEYDKRRHALRHVGERKEYDVCQLYHSEYDDPPPPRIGIWCASIARAHWFMWLTMIAVTLSAVWLGIDADTNDNQGHAYDADTHFIVVDHVFCGLFTAEVLVRFGAFRIKCKCLTDSWFVFDSALVLLMVFETLVLPPAVLLFSDGSGATGLKEMTLLRLLRLTRVARLLRAFPEVVTIIKGIAAATRSVFITLLLVLALDYIFGIFFKQQMEVLDTELAEKYFPTVLGAMWTLLIQGTLLDNTAKVLNPLRKSAGAGMTAAFLAYIFMSSFTLMNMLVGILCEVVSAVSEKEKQMNAKQYLKHNLMEILECYDQDDTQELGRQELRLIMQNPEVHEALRKFGTAVEGVQGLVEAMFADEHKRKLSIHEFMSMVMRLRGSHIAHVTDVVELRTFATRRCCRLEELLSEGIENAHSSKEKQQLLSRRHDTTPSPLRSTSNLTEEAPEWDYVVEHLANIAGLQQRLGNELKDMRGEIGEVKRQLGLSQATTPESVKS